MATRLCKGSRWNVSVCLVKGRYSAACYSSTLIHPHLFIHDGFVNQHDGDFVADGIDAMTGDAPESARIGFELYFRAASRADKDIEEVRADGHERSV
jgi:hypothetical protein